MNKEPKEKEMNRIFLTMAVLFAAMTMQAQDEVLEKYSEMGDVNTVAVTKNMLDRVPMEQFDIPGLNQMLQRIESIKILTSRGDKAGKKMGTKLPKQLSGKGFKEKLTTKKQGRDITVMQSKKDPSRVVMVVYQKPQAIVISMQGDFTNLQEDLKVIK